jgi:hypothetical protein
MELAQAIISVLEFTVRLIFDRHVIKDDTKKVTKEKPKNVEKVVTYKR